LERSAASNSTTCPAKRLKLAKVENVLPVRNDQDHRGRGFMRHRVQLYDHAQDEDDFELIAPTSWKIFIARRGICVCKIVSHDGNAPG
jgi:hypothetical protein